MGSEGLQARYINPYTDFAFKLLFGTDLNKDILIGFLNALFDGKEVIRDVTYLNTEHLGTREPDRRAVFDVYCENEQGEKILIEMQKAEQQFFKDRSLFYSTFPIREQGIKGDWSYELKAVYIIGVLNFTFDRENPDYFHHEVKLMDVKTCKVFYDKLTFVYLEMPKFHKTEEELETFFDKWMFVLRNLSRLMEKPAALQERIFQRVFDAAEIARFSAEKRYEYEESLKAYRDWNNSLDTAKNKGIAIGREQGREEGMRKGREEGMREGREEEKRAIAKALKAEGMPLSSILRLTGLTEEDIKEL
ncbi:MAG: Rpn family recombination-promoting nuclease/putative transposase [Bacteroidales bacterium]|nr:Rpn family recombination-promoting nuclease/putative transposase [Bacteroidales bacterium]